MLNNITEHTAFIDNNRVCLGDIYEYLNENINDIDDSIKNKIWKGACILIIDTKAYFQINK